MAPRGRHRGGGGGRAEAPSGATGLPATVALPRCGPIPAVLAVAEPLLEAGGAPLRMRHPAPRRIAAATQAAKQRREVPRARPGLTPPPPRLPPLPGDGVGHAQVVEDFVEGLRQPEHLKIFGGRFGSAPMSNSAAAGNMAWFIRSLQAKASSCAARRATAVRSQAARRGWEGFGWVGRGRGGEVGAGGGEGLARTLLGNSR